MKTPRGVTLIELAVVLAVMGVLATLAYSNLARQRPRANLASATVELHALLRNARQNALSTGRDTAVLVFPQQHNDVGGTGSVVAYEDTAHTLFGGTPPNFASFDPHQLAAADNLLGKLDLPKGITVGLGGAAPPTLTAPYSGITAGACSFCAGSGDLRGAVVFDPRGRASFHSGTGAALDVFGGTVGLQGTPDVNGYRLLIITSATGSVRVVNDG